MPEKETLSPVDVSLQRIKDERTEQDILESLRHLEVKRAWLEDQLREVRNRLQVKS